MSYERHPRRRRASAAALLMRSAAGFILAAALLALAIVPSRGAQPQHVVTMKQMRFNPPQIRVDAGDTVEWKNEDIYSHTVTANDGSFDSGLIAPNGSWRTTIKGTGTVVYHCRPHPNMTGELVIQAH